MILELPAPAKINLHLHVTGKRGDGYHLLESIVAFTEVADYITVSSSENLSLTVEGPFAPQLPSDGNIVLKAAEKLAAWAGIAPKASITLQKNIPLGAGLGGGSSDAATTLHLLSSLWGISPDTSTLHNIALSLGADVPMFIEKQAAFMSGVGEKLLPMANMPELYAVLVNPGVHLATPDVFKAGGMTFSASEKDVASVVGRDDVLDYVLQCRNDLEAAAIALAPVVATVLSVIKGLNGCLLSRMSGSGATCFGLFRMQAEAENAAFAMRNAYPQWWVQATKVLYSGLS